MGEGRFAGVDWASEEHAVCVVDADGRIVEGRRYRHDERGHPGVVRRGWSSSGWGWSRSSVPTGC